MAGVPGKKRKSNENNKSLLDYFSKEKQSRLLNNTECVATADNRAENASHSEILQASDDAVSPLTSVAAVVLPDSNCPVSSDVDASGTASSLPPPPSASASNPCVYSNADIGVHIQNISQLDDSTKALLLEKPWTPPENYAFPYCTVTKKEKQVKKYAQRSHLSRFHWLVISDKDQGLYCKYCAIFLNSRGVGRSKIPASKQLVTGPLVRFDDLLGQSGALTHHATRDYHKAALELGKNFLLTFHKSDLEVSSQLSAQLLAQKRENRERLLPIVKTIIFSGRENLPLRGHRDSGNLYQNTTDAQTENGEGQGPVHGQGVFRALLDFRVESGDDVLKNHLLTASANATYISPRIQNELIDCCKEEIQEALVDRVKNAPFYSLMFDESPDAGHKSQLSLSFRYPFHENGKWVIREDLYGFVDAYDSIRPEDLNNGERRLTGVAVAHVVEDVVISKVSLEPRRCVGIGTDSCSVMASEVKGAVQELIKKFPNARRTPCSSHILNNSLAQSNKVMPCRNATGTMKKVIAFANASTKRFDVFKEHLGCSIEHLCETRWVEKHDGHLQFKQGLPKMCKALDVIGNWQDTDTASGAYCLKQALCSSEFIVATHCLCSVFGATVSLSRKLQSKTLDLNAASDAINDTIQVLKMKRENAESVFRAVFAEAQQIAEELGVEITAPRTAGIQRYRENQPADTPEEYYRRSIFVPLLDNILSDIRDRYPEDVLKAFDLRVFMPKPSYSSYCAETHAEELKQVKKVAEMYADILPPFSNVSTVVNEFENWKIRWQRLSADTQFVTPSTVVEVMDLCDRDLYPCIFLLLAVLAALPVSVATAERSFSTLRRLKTWLRTTMTQDRLVGLALLHVHKDIPVRPENIIDRFAKKKSRKIDFSL